MTSVTKATHDRPLTGRTALVTGGMGGIGAATADTLLAQGANVAITYVPGLDAEASVRERCRDTTRTSAHPLDLRDHASITRCIGEAVARWSGIDILVNNAAVGSATVGDFEADTATQDTAMLVINADGTLKMCQAYLAAMRGSPAPAPRKIINVSSVGGGIGAFPGFRLSDGMSKAAIAHLTRQLAAESVHEGFDVFAVCPGATNTRMFQKSTLDPMTPEARAAFIASLPKGRLIEPEEIAAIIAFLCGLHSTPMHGAVIDCSMGLGVRPGLVTEGRH